MAPPTAAGHPAVPQTLAPTPTLSGLLVALRRRLCLALVLGLVGGVVAAAASWRFVPEPKHQVRAMVHIAAVPERILGQSRGEGGTQFAYFQKTQITLVKSQVVLETVLNNPEVARLRTVSRQASPKDWLFSNLEADFKQGPEVLTIGIKGDQSADLVVVVNEVVKAYLDAFINTEHNRRRARLQKLTELRQQHEKALNEKRAKLRELAPRMGGGHPGLLTGLHEGLLRQINSTNEELQTVQGELARAEIVSQRKEQQLTTALSSKAAPPDDAIDQEMNKDLWVKHYSEEVTRLDQIVMRTRRTAATPKGAAKKLRDDGTLTELEDARQALESRRSKLRAEVVARLKAKKVAVAQAELEQSQEQLSYLRGREKRLLASLTDLARQSRDRGEEAFKLSLLVREVEDEDKIVTAIVSEIRALRLDMVAPPRAKPLDQAVVTANVGRKRLLFTAGGAVGIAFLAVAGIALWEFRKRKIEFVDEVMHGFGIGVVGTLPALRWSRPGGGRDTQQVEKWSGCIDSFRTILLRGENGARVRVLLITSAEPGEGKTSLAAHLSVSLARAGRRTLLLDGDMRNPTAHRLFGLARSPGLSEVLRQQAPINDAIRATAVPGLWVLPAGESVPTAFQRLGNSLLPELFLGLKQGFDVIVVDSCPVLPVADTLHLAQCADGVVFSILRRVSRLPKLSAALYQMRMVGVPVLGAVVSGTDEDVYGTGYYAHVPTADV